MKYFHVVSPSRRINLAKSNQNSSGGVVTFTPEAIMDDYLGVLNRIRQIESHPLWTCYILPSVLGMVARHEIKGQGLPDMVD